MANQLASFFASIDIKGNIKPIQDAIDGFVKLGAASRGAAAELKNNMSKSVEDLRKINSDYGNRERDTRSKEHAQRIAQELKTQAKMQSVRAKDYDAHIYAFKNQQEKLQRIEDAALRERNKKTTAYYNDMIAKAKGGGGGGHHGGGFAGKAVMFGEGLAGMRMGGFAAMHGKLSYLLEGLGVAAIAKQSYEVANFNQALAPTFKFVTGSSKQAAEEIRFVRQESDRLGLSYMETANSYKKMFASTYRNLGTEGSRKLFTGFSELGSLLGLGKEQQKRVFVALTSGAN